MTERASGPIDGPIVALVAARDQADEVAATVAALWSVGGIDRVVLIDDGSSDTTSDVAREAGAEVLRLEASRGKGGAVRAGVEATPEADVYVLADPDVAATGSWAAVEAARAVVAPVCTGEVDMAIAAVPISGGRVRRLARWGIRRASGREMRAPMSGLRAVQASVLRQADPAERSGFEVGLTIDAARSGASVVEVEVGTDRRPPPEMSLAHRARQGADVGAALWPRLTTSRIRTGLALLAFAAVLMGALWSGGRWVPASAALPTRPEKMVVFSMSPMGFKDLGRGFTPTLDQLMQEGSVGAMSVRTVSRNPSLAEGYLSMGAGYRLAASDSAGEAYGSSADLGTGTAAQVLFGLSGRPVRGTISVVGAAPTLERNDGVGNPVGPGALGDALRRAGLTGAVISNGDQPDLIRGGPKVVSRPAALAVMDDSLSVPNGTVEPGNLLEDGPIAPFGVRADPDKVLAAVEAASRRSDVIVVDPGDLQRSEAFAAAAAVPAQRRARNDALERTDGILADILEWADDDTLVMVVSVAPPGGSFRLTPVAVTGAGVPAGYLVSPSTKREGIVALTDVAPTILAALGADVPGDMPGHAVRYRAAEVDMGLLRDHDRDTNFRERTYFPQAMVFIVFQAILYLLGAFVLSRRNRVLRTGPALRLLVLGAASFPVSTFLLKAIPDSSALGAWAFPLVLAITAAIALFAARSRRTPLSALNRVMALTVAVIVVDACTGTFLHLSSWLGYSLHSAGRFYGLPNTSFAVLAASGLLLVCAYIQYAPRRGEALVAGGLLLTFLAIVDGGPSMGGDVGGILTLVPVFGLSLFALTGRRIRFRTLVLVALVAVVSIAVVGGLDLLRAPEARTHLGRFIAQAVEDGPSELTELFFRKQSANLRILRVSIWTWMLPITIGFLLYVLVWERQWSDLLPPGSPLRIGAVAGASGALLGFLANDSGPIVIALFLVYLLPYLTLLALHRGRGTPTLLGPTGPPVPVGDSPGARLPEPVGVG